MFRKKFICLQKNVFFMQNYVYRTGFSSGYSTAGSLCRINTIERRNPPSAGLNLKPETENIRDDEGKTILKLLRSDYRFTENIKVQYGGIRLSSVKFYHPIRNWEALIHTRAYSRSSFDQSEELVFNEKVDILDRNIKRSNGKTTQDDENNADDNVVDLRPKKQISPTFLERRIYNYSQDDVSVRNSSRGNSLVSSARGSAHELTSNDLLSCINPSDGVPLETEIDNSETSQPSTLLRPLKHHKHREFDEEIQNLFPHPKSVLHNIMDLVAKELDNREYKVHPVFNAIKEKNKAGLWCCTYNLKWPDQVKFVAQGKTKLDCSTSAAYTVLSWLKKNGKIDTNGQPILIDKEQAKIIKRQDLKLLNFNLPTVQGMEEIIRLHNDQFILPKVVSEQSVDNEDIAIEELDDEKFTKMKRQKFISAGTYIAREKLKLPITQYKDKFVDLLGRNQVVIVKGEPGCGKSTRIPQYVLESWVLGSDNPATVPCRIAVTQPRRIAAISLATRVASERNESPGNVVGFQVRLKSNFNASTGRILYCTTGILLRHMQFDQNLENFTHIILDEAHERDVNTDLLMNLLRSAIKANPNLKVIVMSATIDTDMFQKYFDDAPIIEIPGFTYPVREHFLNDIKKLDLSKTVKMCESPSPSVVHDDVTKVIKMIHNTRREGAILCFLPGWEEIRKVQKALPTTSDMTVKCLHSRLQDAEQWQIFSRPPPGVRKVILATNIAETSVTIDDVVYVVDTGIHKEKRFDNTKGVDCIDNYWVSKSSMIQRKGRAGRCQPGESFHLYSRSKYEQFSDFSIPQILRTSLTKILLDSKVFSNNLNALEFMNQLPSPPDAASTLRAVQELTELELLDDHENLTPLGRVLADFQLEPKLAKTLVNSVVYKCTSPIVDIVTLYSADTELFSGALTNKDQVKQIKATHCAGSDHLALMRIFEKYLELADDQDQRSIHDFCTRLCLVPYKLELLAKIRQIHFEYLHSGLKGGLPIADDYSDNDELVKGVLLSGVGTILQHRNWDIVKGRLKKQNVFFSSNNYKSTLAMESVNFRKTNFPSNLLVYINETRSNIRRISVVRECSVISPLAVFLFSNKKITINKTDDEQDQIVIGLKDTKIEFGCPKEQAEILVNCKNALADGYQYFIYQLTEGGEWNADAIKTWNEMLKKLNGIMLKNAV